ncbi:MAG: DUF4199 domain-containing protein [Chitinophagaceae bacterium]
METIVERKVMSPIVKGVIITLAVIAFAVTTALIGIEKAKNFGWVQYLIIIGGIIWACISYSSQNEANVTFGNVFAHGFKVTAVVTCLFILYMVLALKVIFPGIREQSIAIMKTEIAKQPKKPNQDSEQMEKIIKGVSDNFVLITATGTMIVFLIVGAAASLAGAVVAKKNPNANPLG